MRALISLAEALLIVIALLGIGSGVCIVAVVDKRNVAQLVTAIVTGSIPFAIGTVALGTVAIVWTVTMTSKDQVAAINRGTEVAINEAKLAEHRERAALAEAAAQAKRARDERRRPPTQP